MRPVARISVQAITTRKSALASNTLEDCNELAPLAMSMVASGFAFMTRRAVVLMSLKDRLIGTWNVISQEQTFPDGSKRLAFGPDLRGVNVYTSDGRFFVLIVRNDLPKIATGDRTKATAVEAQAIVAGSIGYFGSYTVDEASKTIAYRIDGTTLANMLGIGQKRVILMLTADELRYRNTAPNAGGQIEVVLRRAK